MIGDLRDGREWPLGFNSPGIPEGESDVWTTVASVIPGATCFVPERFMVHDQCTAGVTILGIFDQHGGRISGITNRPASDFGESAAPRPFAHAPGIPVGGRVRIRVRAQATGAAGKRFMAVLFGTMQ